MNALINELKVNLDIPGGIFGILMAVLVVGCYLALKAVIHPYYWLSDKLNEKRVETAGFESRHEFL
jgi:hypothetical protein